MITQFLRMTNKKKYKKNRKDLETLMLELLKNEKKK